MNDTADLLAVIDVVERNLRAGRRMVGVVAPRAHLASEAQPALVGSETIGAGRA
jgi:hypothetical protein